jgi:predicted small lipoprotein YifL
MSRRAVLLVWAVLAGLVSVGGCGPQGPKLYPVSGTVTWNDAPLPDGDIIFAPESPGDVEDAGKIKDGKFSFMARPGNKKVKILATREEGPADPQMGAPPRKQYLPPKYSSGEITELRAVVKESDTKDGNVYEFKLSP